jgi:NADH:ubiquinone oxidoreductase subunit E
VIEKGEEEEQASSICMAEPDIFTSSRVLPAGDSVQFTKANITPSSSTPMASIRSMTLGSCDMVITHDVPTNVVPVGKEEVEKERSEIGRTRGCYQHGSLR